MTPSESFAQLELRFSDPIQYEYEVIRPIFLFGDTVAERSRETGIPRTTVADKARRFVERGMLGLVRQYVRQASGVEHAYPEPIAAYILYLKVIYPPIHLREIERIIAHRFGYETNHHTIKHFLARHPLPVQLQLDLGLPPTYHAYTDAYQARWHVVKMHREGWNQKSIAALLQLSRRHVGRILETFAREGFEGLEDKRARPENHPANQMSLPFLKEVLDLQQAYPRAGRFRVHGLLSQSRDEPPASMSTVARAMALNRQFHDAPPAWRSDRPDPASDSTLKYLPYRPQYRQQLWYIDIRYLVQLDGRWLYSVCIIEGYSRKILAGMASEYQDLIAILQLLRAALAEYGCPEGLVSDNGSVFRARDYQRILQALQIEPLHIEKGAPWENLIEAQFKVQLRLADAKFEQAPSVEEVQACHAAFVETFNTTPHWAHREREDGYLSPVEVLQWVRGRAVEPGQLEGLFQQLQVVRTVNRFGFVSIQRFYVYAERGLEKRRVSVWIYDGRLHIEYQQQMLAHYQYKLQRGSRRLAEITQPALYDTPFASPQIALWELTEDQWLQVLKRPYIPRYKLTQPTAEQLPLLQLASYLVFLQLVAS